MPPLEGVLRTDVDEVANIVRVHGSGLWSLSYALAHFNELDRILQRARLRTSMVKVLVDIREAAVQTPATAACLADATHRIYRPGDRVAIVVSSSLIKLQMRRIIDASIHEIFISPAAAEIWLNAWS